MTIDEAISHAREVAENDGCTKCAEEHKQLAEWLEELKDLRKWKEQGREELIAEILKLPRLNHYDMYDELMYQSIRVDDIERLRERKQDSQETEPDNIILNDFFKGDA